MNENGDPEATTNSVGDIYRCIESFTAKNFGAVFISKLIIRLFDYSVFAASERTDPPREGDAKILFNFEWPYTVEN